MIAFHRFLIGTAIVFCAGFSVWALLAFRANGGAGPLGLGGTFALCTPALSYYLKDLRGVLGDDEPRRGRPGHVLGGRPVRVHAHPVLRHRDRRLVVSTEETQGGCP